MGTGLIQTCQPSAECHSIHFVRRGGVSPNVGEYVYSMSPCVCVCACSFYDSLSTELQPETLKLISPTGSIHTPLWVWIHTHRRRKTSFTHSDVKSWNNVLAYCTVTTCWCVYVFVHIYTDTYKRAVYYNSCIQERSWITTITPSRCIPMEWEHFEPNKITTGSSIHTNTQSSSLEIPLVTDVEGTWCNAKKQISISVQISSNPEQ